MPTNNEKIRNRKIGEEYARKRKIIQIFHALSFIAVIMIGVYIVAPQNEFTMSVPVFIAISVLVIAATVVPYLAHQKYCAHCPACNEPLGKNYEDGDLPIMASVKECPGCKISLKPES